MKHKGSLIGTMLMALLMVAMAVAPAFAQTGEGSPASEPISKPITKALGIRAPRVALADREITITVFERGTRNPVADAGIWAVPADQAEALRNEAQSIKSAEANPAEYDYESLCNLYGTFLGRTASDGQLKHTFSEAGKYVLVTAKIGYYPGFSPIRIRTLPKVLGLRAPHLAQVNEDITMTVFQRGTHEPIEGAGVWAFSTDTAETVRQQIFDIKATAGATDEEPDYESLMNTYGEFLGRTNAQGQFTCTFAEADKYILVTWKSGYWPGFSPLRVYQQPRVLDIKAPWVAEVNEDVTVKVFERRTLDPVEGAHVWAFTWDQEGILRGAIEDAKGTLQENAQNSGIESIVSGLGGTYLGKTGTSGELTHAFAEEGRYLIVTVKNGYWPGFHKLAIRAPQPVEPMGIEESVPIE